MTRAAAPILPAAKALYSVREALDLLGLGRSTLYRHISRGALPTHKLGSRTVIARADLEGFIQTGGAN